MKIYYIIFFGLLFSDFSALGQGLPKEYDNYTELEIEIEKCLDIWIESKNVNWNDLKPIFENYFSTGEIINAKDPIEKQYYDILSYWENPTKKSPIFYNKKKVVDIKNKLSLTKEDIKSKCYLDCFTNKYILNKATIDTNSSLYAFGSTLEAIKTYHDISPGLIAGAIKMEMNKADLKKDLYQKTIVLLFCFDMTLYLTDGSIQMTHHTSSTQNNYKHKDTLSVLISMINGLSKGKNVNDELFELEAKRVNNSSIQLIEKLKGSNGSITTSYLLKFNEIDAKKTKVNITDNTCYIHFFSKNGTRFDISTLQKSKITIVSNDSRDNFYIGFWDIDNNYENLLKIKKYIEYLIIQSK